MTKNKRNVIELLAPAGNLEKMKTALTFGADAVYAGIPDFSLRVRINDFDLEKIQEATELCHQLGKKIYITTNIFAHNKHLDKLTEYVKVLKKIGVDALIAADPGVIQVIKSVWSQAEIHLSTQANCTNWQAAKFWHDLGVQRVVLGREVALSEIKEIKKRVPKLELEYFIHGAMCMAYSGRCFLSKHFVDKSANLGDCVQPCRWKYNVKHEKLNSDSHFISEEKRPNSPLEIIEEEHGTYILNSKDLMLLDYLEELIDAGVTSFKIEGRAKSVYYQAMIAGIYRRAIDLLLTDKKEAKKEIKKMKKDLEEKIVSRGFTTGFLVGDKADEDIENTHQAIGWEFCGQVVKASTKKGKSFLTLVKVHNVIKTGDEIEIVMPYYEVKKMKLKKMYDVKTEELIEKAHGGQEKMVLIETSFEIPEFSVLRRKV
ncbi:U32 family peptidase C-terminal domain-containing protein [Candidatus Parcubacteria bacterium]|nr:U32 family peptidase C-terminal domain-containing protein [Patescibacteria group bacterium]MBU4308890.1 U32 family peptidase C-terminal domain-containing protein [Patescibacteria group bacterium]MBU4432729.1 U32 family peptidase C-terminal domain-containing protein [Patescibacteria group bacterium]MBU4577250.1 U32 family peptidase C-terminal domain-containing protein [Patescibacteria group bacterium]MCG2696941.1 U32 family peptidase C-terminal domain-containing protein [Candidatus Parcubacte